MTYNEETLLVFAFRYALGRRSAAPGIVADELIRRWPDMSVWSRQQIRNETADAIHRGNAGDFCDVVTWQKLLPPPPEDPSSFSA